MLRREILNDFQIENEKLREVGEIQQSELRSGSTLDFPALHTHSDIVGYCIVEFTTELENLIRGDVYDVQR